MREADRTTTASLGENSDVKIQTKRADVDEVEAAAKNLAQTDTQQLEARFTAMPLMEKCSIFDPHNFPTEEDLVQDIGNVEMEALVEFFGNNHETVGACISAADAKREWDGIKDIMLTVRKSPPIANTITLLGLEANKVDEAEGSKRTRPTWIWENAHYPVRNKCAWH